MAIVYITQYDALGTDGAGNILPGYPSRPLVDTTKADVTTLTKVVDLEPNTRFLCIWADGAIEWREGEDPQNSGYFTPQAAIIEKTVRVAEPRKDANRQDIVRSVSVREMTAP